MLLLLLLVHDERSVAVVVLLLLLLLPLLAAVPNPLLPSQLHPRVMVRGMVVVMLLVGGGHGLDAPEGLQCRVDLGLRLL